MDKSKIVFAIPAYNPDEKLHKMILQLNEEGYKNIVCVNDGSDNDKIFDCLADENCHLLTHTINLGKGRALKTAFEYIQSIYSDDCYVVTVDADGQHDLESVECCIKEMNSHKKERCIVLGARQFRASEEEMIPFRSWFGNIVTRYITRMLYGLRISDTQTGLRVFSCVLLPYLLSIEGERYEYEMNVLIQTKRNDIHLYEIPISTIYEEDNQSSHFNPLMDSIRIYKVILKYSMVSVASVVLEYMVFGIAMWFSHGIVLSTYTARALSSICNFCMNRNYVFQKKTSVIKQIVKYYVLVFVSATVSAVFVTMLSENFIGNPFVSKMIVDTILFFLNYFMQKKIVFK